jgi:hypothetical protein
MIAKPNTELRSLAISALASKGYVGPNYNLDDVSATITKNGNCFDVSFWGMSCTVDENHKLYNKFVKEFETKTFTLENFDNLKQICEKIIAISNENVDGSLMFSQLMCLGDNIKEFEENPIIKNYGIVNYQIIEIFTKKINSFAKLEKNWNSHDSEIISDIAINSALNILPYLNKNNLLSDKIDIYPMACGGIQFEFHFDNYSELEIDPVGRMTYTIFDAYSILTQKKSTNITDLL